jgi:hypothetical protein
VIPWCDSISKQRDFQEISKKIVKKLGWDLASELYFLHQSMNVYADIKPKIYYLWIMNFRIQKLLILIVYVLKESNDNHMFNLDIIECHKLY